MEKGKLKGGFDERDREYWCHTTGSGEKPSKTKKGFLILVIVLV